MGLLGKRVRSSRRKPRPHLSLYLAQPTRHQDLQRCAMGIAIVTTSIYMGPQARSDLQGSCFQAFMFKFFAGVPCGSVSCTAVERQERAHTDNRGFFVVLAYFWQRSEADVPWG